MLIDGRHIGLTKEQLAKRRSCIGGSDANYIMAGGEKLWSLWEFKTGARDPDDLSGVLAVLMGQFTEPLNCFWFEQKTGMEVLSRGEECRHTDIEYMTTTLDGIAMLPGDKGYVKDADLVFEAKHVGGREERTTILDRYSPQLTHNMLVTGIKKAVLSVFEGNSVHWFEEIELDPVYADELLDREAQFWGWVQSNTRPPDMPAVAAPVAAVKSYDMSKSNSWAEHAGLWVRNKSFAKMFATAEKALKESVPADAAECFGHGIKIKRARNGNLSIKEHFDAADAINA